ncbi:MAG: hypothetical protein AAFO89_07690 [Planctomycetota bacterium]
MRTTVLKHTLPDGSWHVDWLIEVDETPRPRVPTFRLADRPDQLRVPTFTAERLTDHRRLYLDYEGPVSGGRGHVERLSTGRVINVALAEDEIQLQVTLNGLAWHWQGARSGNGVWKFNCIAPVD